MTTTRRPLTVLTLTALVAGLAACTGGGRTADEAGSPTAATPPADATEDVVVVRAPDVDCAGLEPMLGPLLDGLELDLDAGAAPDGTVSCGWVPGTEVEGDPVLRVEIAPAPDDVPDVGEDVGGEDAGDEDAGGEDEGYRTDPRLDRFGGVVLWRPLDQNVVGGAAGAVVVPGLEIVVSSVGYPAGAGLDLDTLVTFAVEVLELSTV